jgi:hypothetical protein
LGTATFGSVGLVVPLPMVGVVPLEPVTGTVGVVVLVLLLGVVPLESLLPSPLFR